MNLRNIFTVYGKELRDSLRDRRTLMSMIVVPTLMIPGIMLTAGVISYKVVSKAQAETPSVMLLGGGDSPLVRGALEADAKIRILPATPDWKQRIIDKQLRAALEIPPGFDETLARGEPAVVKIFNYESELRSGFAVNELRNFFNDYREEPFPGEDRVIIPSKAVASFDLAPEMSAKEIAEKVIELMEKKDYTFILLNFANADIVGHTGNEKATIAAAETIDKCLEKIIKAVLTKKGCLLITADHGNAEEMINNHTGEADTEHSSNPVPCWYITSENHKDTPKPTGMPMVVGLLSDVAPTILKILDIEKPEEMTGESLLDVLV